MKRVLSGLLAFLGVACITAAIAIPLGLVSQLKVVPLDLDITSDSTTVAADGSPGERYPAVIFDRCSVSQSKARTLQAHLTQQRRSVIVDPSDSRSATVQSAQTVRIDRTRTADGDETTPQAPAATGDLKCNDGLLTASIDRVSVNRKSSVPDGKVNSLQLEAIPEGGTAKDVSVEPESRKGFQYKFPFDTKKQQYYYYDLNTRQDTVVNFVGEQTIDGVLTYHFKTEVPETDLSNLPNAQNEAALGTMLSMPARWWGITGRGIKPTDQITMHRYAAATREVWVEPQTGTIINGREAQHQYFRSPDKDDESTAEPIRNFQMDALKATFQWTDSTVAGQADKAKHYTGLLKLGNLWLPLILGIVGALLVLAWLVLFLRGRRRNDDEPADTTPVSGPTDGNTVRLDKSGSGPATGAGAAAGAGAATAVIAGSRSSDAEPSDDEDAYLWDRQTQQIPRVEGSVPKLDSDFNPVQGNPDGDDGDTAVHPRPE